MTRNEFGEWLTRLKAAFPSVERFFTRDDPEAAANVFTLWLDVLHVVPLQSADEAIRALVAGELDDLPPKYIDDWAKLPSVVRRWCRDNKPMHLDEPSHYSEDRAYRCLKCLDRGYGVEVFNPVWVREFSNEIELGALGERWWLDADYWCRQRGCGGFTYTVDCNCERGLRQQQIRRNEKQAMNDKLHCLKPGGGPREWLAALQDHVQCHPALELNTWTP